MLSSACLALCNNLQQSVIIVSKVLEGILKQQPSSIGGMIPRLVDVFHDTLDLLIHFYLLAIKKVGLGKMYSRNKALCNILISILVIALGEKLISGAASSLAIAENKPYDYNHKPVLNSATQASDSAWMSTFKAKTSPWDGSPYNLGGILYALFQIAYGTLAISLPFLRLNRNRQLSFALATLVLIVGYNYGFEIIGPTAGLVSGLEIMHEGLSKFWTIIFTSQTSPTAAVPKPKPNPKPKPSSSASSTFSRYLALLSTYLLIRCHTITCEHAYFCAAYVIFFSAAVVGEMTEGLNPQQQHG